MRISSFGYLVKEGSKSVWVNRLMSFAAIGVLTACMLLIGASTLLSVNMNNAVGFMAAQNEVVVVLKDDLDESQLETYDQQIRDIENLSEVTFVSKEQALEEQKESLGEAADLFEMYGDDNPFPNLYRVRVKDLEQLDATVEELVQLEGTEEGGVKAPTDVAVTLIGIQKIVFFMGLGIIVLLIAVTLVIIANTIKITVFNRRKEISIMKYVGATDTFIKLPFMIEGLLLGLLSAVIAYFILWGGYTYLLDWMAQNPSDWIQTAVEMALPFQEIGLRLFVGFAVGGVTLGSLGSMIFVRNYLKV